MLYIKNTTVIDPIENRLYQADLQIDQGKIVKIKEYPAGQSTKTKLSQTLSEEAEESILTQAQPQVIDTTGAMTAQPQVIDATGLMTAPGLADTHVHFRDPGFTYKEDIETGAAAAAKGGFTEIVLMANTKPPVDNLETLRYVLEKGKNTKIHIETCANVTRGMAGKELVNMKQLAGQGAIGFTDDGIPLMDVQLVREAMMRAENLRKPISFHEEDPALITSNGINEGKASAFYQVKGSPREAEISLVKRDLELALETGAQVVIQHISCRETVELIRKAKKKGVHVYGEATPHHFTLTQDAVIEKGTLAKMNPPLREEADRLAIIEGLADGTIDVIATDHAPHSQEEKQRPITEAPSGIIGLETALSLGIRELVEKDYLTWPMLIERMSTAPCKLYGLEGGIIREGARADLVLFHPTEMQTYQHFSSKSDNSPFKNEKMPGVVYYTICDGEIIYQK